MEESLGETLYVYEEERNQAIWLLACFRETAAVGGDEKSGVDALAVLFDSMTINDAEEEAVCTTDVFGIKSRRSWTSTTSTRTTLVIASFIRARCIGNPIHFLLFLYSVRGQKKKKATLARQTSTSKFFSLCRHDDQ